jgi:hypothetical protein
VNFPTHFPVVHLAAQPFCIAVLAVVCLAAETIPLRASMRGQSREVIQ